MNESVHNPTAMAETELKPKNKGQFRPGEGGRPKGVQNKLPKEAKEVIAEAASRLGGVDRLIAWAQQDPLNERAFWASIYPKLLPLTVNANATITVQRIQRLIVDPKCET